MENIIFSIDVPVAFTTIRVDGGEYNKEKDCTLIEISCPGLDFSFEIQGEYQSESAKKDLGNGVRELSRRGALHLCSKQLQVVLKELKELKDV